MSSKILSGILAVASIAVMFVPGLQPIGILGLKISSAALISAGLAIGASLLAPKPKLSSAATNRLLATFEPNAPRAIVFGHTALATDIRYHSYTDEQTYYHQILCVASHEVEAIDQIWFDSELAWSASGGVTSKWSGYLTVSPKLVGTAGNTVSIDANWGANQRLTGCAYIHLRYKLTGNSKKAESPFSGSIPSRVTVRGKAALLPDIRETGCEADDQATWDWFSDDSGRNPALQLLFYLIGWRINDKLAVGRGIPVNRLDLDSFITAANFCDEPVSLALGGTEPRYRCDGAFSEADDPSLVIGNLCAAMNAVLRDNGGQIAAHCLMNDLAAPVAAFTEADIIEGDDWLQTPPVDEYFETVRGKYTDPSDTALYQLVDYPEVQIGEDDSRVDVFDLPCVQSASQAQRLAKTRLQRNLYRGVFTAVFNHRAWQVNLGDPVTLSHSALGWEDKLFRVASHSIGLDGRVEMALNEEHEDIYAWEEDESPAVEAAEPTAYDPLLNPFVLALYDVAGAGPQMLRDDSFISTYWALATGGFRLEWAPSRTGKATNIAFTASTDVWLYSKAPTPALMPVARDGKAVFLRIVADPSGFDEAKIVDDDGNYVVDDDDNNIVVSDVAPTFDLEVRLEWLDIDMEPISDVLLATLDPGDGIQEVVRNAIPDTGGLARFVRVKIGYPSQTGKEGSWLIYEPWLAEYQPTADNTEENQVVVVPPPMPVIAADYQGTINLDQFPKVLTPQVTRGGVSIRTEDEVSYALDNISGGGAGAVSVNDTDGSDDKGRVTITDDMTATFTFDYLVTVNGTVQPAIKFEIKVQNAAPPATGGGGGSNPDGGSFPATGSRNNTTFTEVGRVEDVVKGTGQTIFGYAPVTYDYYQVSGSGSGAIRAKWQYSVAGAESWTDFGAYVTGTAAEWFAVDFSGNPGAVTCNQSVAPSNGTYDIRLVMSADGALAGSLVLAGNTCTVELG